MKGNLARAVAIGSALTFAAGCLAPRLVSAQDAAPDSTDLRNRIQGAQRDVESARRAHLPVVPLVYGPYVASIGNRNIWVESPRRDPVPATHPDIDSARARLLGLLRSAAELLPGDAWIAGLRVQYHLDDSNAPAARAAIRDCEPEIVWWCYALRGFIEHVGHAYATAELAFGSALALMDEETRCEWTDLSPVLSGRASAEYRDYPCSERAGIQERLLWFSDPLYGTPGNELWTEHLSRHVYSRMIRRSLLPDGETWSRNRHRTIIRYGRPMWWSTDRPNAWSANRSVSLHHDAASTYLFPSSIPGDLHWPEDIWDWNPLRPRSWHVAGHGLFFSDTLPHTLLRFPRGESQVIAVATELFSDTAFAPRGGSVSLFLGTGPDAQLVHADTGLSGGHAVLYTTVPATALLMSLEAVDQNARHARRRRYTIEPIPFSAAGVAVSDLMVIEGGGPPPSQLTEALARYRPRHPFAPGDEVGLYWEVVNRRHAPVVISASLQIRQTGRSALRRLLERTPLASASTPVDVEWTQYADPADGVFPWAFSVVLPADLGGGSYELRLTLVTERGDEFTRNQSITVLH